MLKRASDWTYTRSHLRCLRKLRSLDILSKSFDLFAQDSHVKACFRLDLYALTSALPTPLPTQATLPRHSVQEF